MGCFLRRLATILVLSLLAKYLVSLCQTSIVDRDTGRHQSITLSGLSIRAVMFLAADSVIVSACTQPQECKLLALQLRGGNVSKSAESESIHFDDPFNESEIYPMKEQRIYFNNAIYRADDFRVARSFDRRPSRVSSDGESLGFIDGNTWCIASASNPGVCIQRGSGLLLAISRNVAVVDTGATVEFINLQASDKHYDIPKGNCHPAAEPLAGDLIVVSTACDARVFSADGHLCLDLGRFVLGYDRIASGASGERLLVLRPVRNISWTQKAMETLQTIATLGMGVPDEEPNAVDLQVSDIRSKRVLLEESLSFESIGDMPTAAISPDGSLVALASGHILRIIVVPKL